MASLSVLSGGTVGGTHSRFGLKCTPWLDVSGAAQSCGKRMCIKCTADNNKATNIVVVGVPVIGHRIMHLHTTHYVSWLLRDMALVVFAARHVISYNAHVLGTSSMRCQCRVGSYARDDEGRAVGGLLGWHVVPLQGVCVGIDRIEGRRQPWR